MSIFGALTNSTGLTSARDNSSAQHATDATDQQLRDGLGVYRSGLNADQALNTQLGNTNYYGNAQQVYGQQQQAANSLQAYANGTAPSAAYMQMQQGLGAANQQEQAAALSQQGGVLSGNTQRNILMAQAANAQNVLGQSAVLRAREQQQGMQQYNQTLGDMQAQQQQQGHLQYTQGQNMLNNANILQNQAYQGNMGTAGQIYGNQMGNIAADAGANAAQATAFGNTLQRFAPAIPGVPK